MLTVTRTVPPGNRVRDEDKNCTEQDPMVYSIDLVLNYRHVQYRGLTYVVTRLIGDKRERDRQA